MGTTRTPPLTTRSTTEHDELRFPWSSVRRLADLRLWLGWLLFGLLWTFFLTGMGRGYWIRGDHVPGAALMVLGAPGAYLVVRAVAQAVNTTVVRVDADGIEVRHGPLFTRVRRWPLDRDPSFEVRENVHRSRVGRWRTYDVIPARSAVAAALLEGLRHREHAEDVTSWLEDKARQRVRSA